MTLDEAIEKELWRATEQYNAANSFHTTHEVHLEETCKKEAEYHRQLAEWLKELKRLREQADVPDTNAGDLISRQAADKLSKELVHTTRDKADFLCHFWEGLQKLPPVTPKAEQKWIPCSERMPEKHGDYLVTIENGDVFNCYFNPDYCYDGYDNGAFTYTQEYFDHETMGSLGAEEFAYDGVVAWMSYEPYKEESEDEE